jgi:hypothetical protein
MAKSERAVLWIQRLDHRCPPSQKPITEVAAREKTATNITPRPTGNSQSQTLRLGSSTGRGEDAKDQFSCEGGAECQKLISSVIIIDLFVTWWP